LSESEFDKLLSYLHADRNQAEIIFEQFRDELVFYFQRNRCAQAEDKADLVITRVAAKLAQEQILDIRKYCYSVARRVLQECWREQGKSPIPLDDLPPSLQMSVNPDVEERLREEARDQERMKECMQKCLQGLEKEKRDLIKGYCLADDRGELAESLGVKLSILRVKIHRIRNGLKKCLANCMDSHKDG
jgi:DNA-directed RNA polymerase specialized sigma24 family protein